jgi:alkylhydroperoxidase family enzyme
MKHGAEETMEPRVDYLRVARGAYEAMLGLENIFNKADSGSCCSICSNYGLRRSTDVPTALICTGKTCGRSAKPSSGYMDSMPGKNPLITMSVTRALLWAEAVTNIRDGHVPDEVYEKVRARFSEKELADLTLAVAAINAWARLAIAARSVPGQYRPVERHEVKKSA